MKLTIYTALLLGLVACTRSEESRPSAEEVPKESGSQLNASALPSFEEKNFSLEESCTKNGGPGAFENVQRAEEDMKQCLQSPINITDVRAENKKYKSTDNLIITFKNYCNERFIKRSCSDNYTDAMKHCLAKTELENEKIVKLNISLLDSVCNKLEDHVADFISAKGPECFQSQQERIQNCVEKTNGSDNNLMELDSLPLLIFNKECE